MVAILQLDDLTRKAGKNLVLVLTRKLLTLCTDKEMEELTEQAPASWTEELVRGMWRDLMATGSCATPAPVKTHLVFSSPASDQHANSRASELYARDNRGVVLEEVLKLREADPCLTLTQAKKRASWKVWKMLATCIREEYMLKVNSPQGRCHRLVAEERNH